MNMMKDEARKLLDRMPDDSQWVDLAYQAYVRAKVEAGLAELDAGLGIPHEQVMQEMDEWLASFGPQQLESITEES